MEIKIFKINCPFCEESIISDIIDNIEEVSGQWQCNNGHTFVLEYIEKIS